MPMPVEDLIVNTKDGKFNGKQPNNKPNNKPTNKSNNKPNNKSNKSNKKSNNTSNNKSTTDINDEPNGKALDGKKGLNWDLGLTQTTSKHIPVRSSLSLCSCIHIF